jgi:hypothetical protein
MTQSFDTQERPALDASALELARVVDRLERARRTAQLPGSSDRRKAAQAIAIREMTAVRAHLEQLLASHVGVRLEPGSLERETADWLVGVLGADARQPTGIPYGLCVCGRVFERQGKRKWCSAECRMVNAVASGHTVKVLVACVKCGSPTAPGPRGAAICGACLLERE